MRWVRPAISLIGMAGITVGFFLKMITVEAYLPVVTAVIIWWFKSRDDSKIKNGAA